jgi:hypothetical protein
MDHVRAEDGAMCRIVPVATLTSMKVSPFRKPDMPGERRAASGELREA